MLDSRLHLCVAALVVAVLVAATGATAKDFRPGDLRVCNTKRCVRVRNPAPLAAFSSFYYNGPQPDTAQRARLRAPSYELRFRNGYTTGIVATARFDRFLSYGVNLDRFIAGTWYQLPKPAAAAIVKLRAVLKPIPRTRSAILRSQ